MNDKLNEAIELILSKIRPNIQPDDSLKYSQAALNLAQAKQLLKEK